LKEGHKIAEKSEKGKTINTQRRNDNDNAADDDNDVDDYTASMASAAMIIMVTMTYYKFAGILNINSPVD
jgi:hypothetical protein